MTQIKRETVRHRVKRGLLDQLEKHNNAADFYKDLVDDYIALWDTKESLIASIREDGAIVEGRFGLKKNDAVAELPKISKRMTDLLQVLCIKADPDEGGGDDV